MRPRSGYGDRASAKAAGTPGIGFGCFRTSRLKLRRHINYEAPDTPEKDKTSNCTVFSCQSVSSLKVSSLCKVYRVEGENCLGLHFRIAGILVVGISGLLRLGLGITPPAACSHLLATKHADEWCCVTQLFRSFCSASC